MITIALGNALCSKECLSCEIILKELQFQCMTIASIPPAIQRNSKSFMICELHKKELDANAGWERIVYGNQARNKYQVEHAKEIKQIRIRDAEMSVEEWRVAERKAQIAKEAAATRALAPPPGTQACTRSSTRPGSCAAPLACTVPRTRQTASGAVSSLWSSSLSAAVSSVVREGADGR